MTVSRLSIALAILLAAAAMAPAASAEAGLLVAHSASYSDVATQHGQLSMLFVSEQSGLPAGDGSRPWIDLQAATIDGFIFEEEAKAAEVQAPAVFSPKVGSPAQTSPTKHEVFTDGHAVLSAFQPGYELHIYTLDGTLAYTSESLGGTLAPTQDMRMRSGLFGNAVDSSGASVAGENPGTGRFAFVERTGDWIVQGQSAARTSLIVQGDFIVELRGLTLQAKDGSHESTLASGTWHDPVADGVPADNAYTQRNLFVRLFVKGATVEVANEGGAPEIGWAAASMSTQNSGPVTLYQTSGHVSGPNGGVDLQDARHVVPSGSILTLSPQGDGMSVGVGATHLGPRSAIASVPAPASAALLGTGAILALAAAVGVGVLRNVLRMPALADVEAAIEEGRYGKAARLAGRILARHPSDESAILARGIALSKAGRNDKVVQELSWHLQSNPATDGSLHYVLGLAHLDLGRTDEGRTALKEAVRLTPALQAEVAPRLGKAFSPHATTTRETHGYA